MRFLWLTLFVLTGCHSVKKQTRPTMNHADQWQQSIETEATYPDILALIEGDDLSALVHTALKNNPDLQQTALRMKEAALLVKLERGARLPSLSLDASAQRGGPLDGSAQSQLSAALTLGFDADVWGRLRDNQRAASEDAVAAAFDYEAARNGLVSQVVLLGLDIITAEQLLELDTQREQVLAHNLDTIRERYRTGKGQLADLDTATTSLEQLRASLVLQQESLAASKRAMSVLLGDDQWQTLVLPKSLPTIATPLPDLPAQVLGQRPDVAAANARLTAADHRAASARKALLPSFRLSLRLDSSGSTLKQLLEGDPLWSLLGGLTAPLFQGGTLRAQADISEVSAEQAWWAYRQTLLNALLEVEDGLGRENMLARRQGHLLRALESARRSEATYEERYRQGLVDVLDLLTAQNAAFDAAAQVIDIERERRANRITLALALGLRGHS